MIKKVINNAVIGIVGGVFIGFMISLILSYASRSTTYYPSSMEFVSRFHGTLMATVTSAVLWGLIGVVSAVSSLIFTDTDWSIVKMTVIHFSLTYFICLPLAFLAGWFSFNFGSFVSFTIIWIILYTIMYVTSMIAARKEVAAVNQKLKN